MITSGRLIRNPGSGIFGNIAQYHHRAIGRVVGRAEAAREWTTKGFTHGRQTLMRNLTDPELDNGQSMCHNSLHRDKGNFAPATSSSHAPAANPSPTSLAVPHTTA